MENGDKQQVISFSKGMSNVPNDVLCGDDTCSEVVGLTSENGEMRPIQKPMVADEQPPAQSSRLIYVHHTQTGKVRIFMLPTVIPGQQGSGYYVRFYYYINPSDTRTLNMATSQDVSFDSIAITSVGNTLIIKSNVGIQYFLFTGTEYHSLGNKIPEPQPKFWLSGGFDIQNEDMIPDGTLYKPSGSISYHIVLDKEEAWNNVVIGAFTKQLNDIRAQKGFYFPFFALTALELYDGSYYLATTPVVLYPNFHTRYWGAINDSPLRLITRMKGQHLYFTQLTDYGNWSDIVRNVTIFVSDGISVCDTTSDAQTIYFGENIPADDAVMSTGFFGESGTKYEFNLNEDSAGRLYSLYQVLLRKEDSHVIGELAETSIFYRLCDIGLNAIENGTSTESYIKQHVLENLTTQTRLDVDGGEYFDHTVKFGESVYSLNGRLHMANIRRSFFDGFKQFISKDNATTHKVEVAIKTPQGIKIVTQEDAFGSVGHYFYYPDPRAEYVRIDGDGNNPIVKKLEEHKGLNGVYCIVSPLDTLTSDTDVTFPTETFVGSYELLPNKVLVSEVDNPFVIRAAGYNTVGNGEVMAIVSNTTALSEGQHGQHPLYAFSTDGIWGLKTNEKGTYSAVDPVSRDICNNAKSVTQTDSAVFFTSEKGLMMIVGAQARCVSEQMNGRTEDWGFTLGSYDSELQALVPVHFKEFLRGCNIAYDYRDSLLWILNENYEWHYVYNIKSGTFALMDDDVTFARVVSDYPDNLLQDTEGQVYTLLNRPDQNEDVQMYEAYITTRPMKFGNALTLKSMREIKHLKDLREGEMHVTLWASNDGKQWVRLNSLRGKAWRYFRLRYAFTGMAATDRFIGTVFVTQERRQWRLR